MNFYVVVYSLGDEHEHTDVYQRYDSYDAALRRYHEVLRFHDLYTASLCLEVEGTD